MLVATTSAHRMQRLTAPFDYLKLSTNRKRFVSEDFVDFCELHTLQRDSRAHAPPAVLKSQVQMNGYLRTPENA